MNDLLSFTLSSSSLHYGSIFSGSRAILLPALSKGLYATLGFSAAFVAVTKACDALATNLYGKDENITNTQLIKKYFFSGSLTVLTGAVSGLVGGVVLTTEIIPLMISVAAIAAAVWLSVHLVEASSKVVTKILNSMYGVSLKEWKELCGETPLIRTSKDWAEHSKMISIELKAGDKNKYPNHPYDVKIVEGTDIGKTNHMPKKSNWSPEYRYIIPQAIKDLKRYIGLIDNLLAGKKLRLVEKGKIEFLGMETNEKDLFEKQKLKFEGILKLWEAE